MGGIATVVSVISGVASYFDSQEAADEAEELAARNAEAERLEAEESARRTGKENERLESESRARAAASGVEFEGSTAEYLAEQKKAGADEVSWIKRSGESRAGIEKQRGKNAASRAKASGYQSLFGAVGTAAEYGGQQGWFKD